MKTAEVLKIVLQKYEIDSLKNLDGTYVLIEEEGGVIEEGKERYRRILDASESPFIAKLNWDHRNLQFAIAKKEEFTNQLVEVLIILFFFFSFFLFFFLFFKN